MPCKLCIPPGWPPSGDTIVLRISPQRAELCKEEEQQHYQDNIGSKDNKQMIEFYIAFFGLVAPLRLLVLISFIWTFNNIRTNIGQKTLLLLLTAVKLLQEFHYSPRRTSATSSCLPAPSDPWLSYALHTNAKASSGSRHCNNNTSNSKRVTHPSSADVYHYIPPLSLSYYHPLSCNRAHPTASATNSIQSSANSASYTTQLHLIWWWEWFNYARPETEHFRSRSTASSHHHWHPSSPLILFYVNMIK